MRGLLEKDEKTVRSLDRTALAIVLRRQLRRHAPVYRGDPFVLVVRVPEGRCPDVERVLGTLRMSEPVLDDIALGPAFSRSRLSLDFRETRSALRLSRRVVVILKEGAVLPSDVIAAADWIEALDPVTPGILVEAQKAAYETVLNPDDAEQLLAYPVDDVLAALRPGRTVADALLRLEAVKGERSDLGVVPLEKLSGYGTAADWGRSVAADIALWRVRELPWREIDAGLLLSGPPGVGKSLYARALARSCDAAFVASSLAQWQANGHLGDTLRAMRATFKEAAEKAPCVLLVDEFDAIGDRTRFDAQNAQYCTEVVSGLLECLDGTFRREGVVVIGACNHPERIDAALLRPGRLGTHVRIDLPTEEERAGIIATHFDNMMIEPDIKRVAGMTGGFSGADIEQLARNARRRARDRKDTLSIEDVIAGLPPTTLIEGELRERICIHEAGHVAVAFALDAGDLVEVVVRASYRGSVAMAGMARFEEGARLPTSKFYSDRVAVCLGGMAAELIFHGHHLDGAGGHEGTDLQRAADLATIMVTQLGMGISLNHLSAKSFEDLDKLRRTTPWISSRVEIILGEQLERAKKLVVDNAWFVSKLASALEREGFVDGVRARELYVSSSRPAAPKRGRRRIVKNR